MTEHKMENKRENMVQGKQISGVCHKSENFIKLEISQKVKDANLSNSLNLHLNTR